MPKLTAPICRWLECGAYRAIVGAAAQADEWRGNGQAPTT